MPSCCHRAQQVPFERRLRGQAEHSLGGAFSLVETETNRLRGRVHCRPIRVLRPLAVDRFSCKITQNLNEKTRIN